MREAGGSVLLHLVPKKTRRAVGLEANYQKYLITIRNTAEASFLVKKLYEN